MPKGLDYPYLRAWCEMMGSREYYVQAMLEKARRDAAPEDAIYWNEIMDEWCAYSGVAPRASCRSFIEQWVAEHAVRA